MIWISSYTQCPGGLVNWSLALSPYLNVILTQPLDLSNISIKLLARPSQLGQWRIMFIQRSQFLIIDTDTVHTEHGSASITPGSICHGEVMSDVNMDSVISSAHHSPFSDDRPPNPVMGSLTINSLTHQYFDTWNQKHWHCIGCFYCQYQMLTIRDHISGPRISSHLDLSRLEVVRRSHRRCLRVCWV